MHEVVKVIHASRKRSPFDTLLLIEPLTYQYPVQEAFLEEMSL